MGKVIQMALNFFLGLKTRETDSIIRVAAEQVEHEVVSILEMGLQMMLTIACAKDNHTKFGVVGLKSGGTIKMRKQKTQVKVSRFKKTFIAFALGFVHNTVGVGGFGNFESVQFVDR